MYIKVVGKDGARKEMSLHLDRTVLVQFTSCKSLSLWRFDDCHDHC